MPLEEPSCVLGVTDATGVSTLGSVLLAAGTLPFLQSMSVGGIVNP
ncbi:hypothetical protein [Cellulomonas sp. URHE0023]|nr:hypothetical protein [Cellulomonas sp. URHE0023]